MKRLYFLFCILFTCGCSNPIEPVTRGFSISTQKLTTSQLNDSTYIFYIDTLQWQTFERIICDTYQTKNTVKISWAAVSHLKSYYYYWGQIPAPLVNSSSYTDPEGKSNTMLAIYKHMLTDTVMVMGGYKWKGKIHADYKYFIISSKN